MKKVLSFPGCFLLLLAACSSPRPVVSAPAVIADSATVIVSASPVIPATDTLLHRLMTQQPVRFQQVLDNKNQLNVQVIYTQIDRGRNGRVKFTDHYFNVNDQHYFYPASTVKLPVAILALQKLNEWGIAGLDPAATMITEAGDAIQKPAFNDPTTATGRPSIAQYIKKILLVSDNDAFNRLYEFLGQEYINNSLHKMGYADAQILHRLDVSLTEEENRTANPVRFFDSSLHLLLEKPAEKSKMIYAARTDKQGTGFMRDGQLVNEPFDFSRKNRLSLTSLHSILRSVLFPDDVAQQQRFNLKPDDYRLLRKYMSMFPAESASPSYDKTDYPDDYVKNWMMEKNGTMPEGIRLFNKTGTAYGYLLDIAYIADFNNHIEFMLSAVIYCNSDGVLNDNQYDYTTTGYPFFRNLGRAVYEYELKRQRNYKPDLSGLQFDWRR